ncbi:hypothetical protein TpMuguga_04g00922 [Theileria parva strain Muguga]|uniref:Uncharacterized protein n=1 Tax=Theileria parva TaxID=5875 RepID=Q4N128_THEPA|nr:uncharacterized protein TpMuguga_04g00922 [Theileria parva strain Muguga]EAN32278.1 hypothetical protein TpMuguga_04g00922 [Theileria parva strain Muguga]|eukprot:XP_764561.1 hypothetical protein [Theileria parva strain Muguga]
MILKDEIWRDSLVKYVESILYEELCSCICYSAMAENWPAQRVKIQRERPPDPLL